MTDQMKKNFTVRITQANKSELIVILYEMYLAYLDDARQALETGQNRAGFREGIRKAGSCVRELMQSLVHRYAVAGQLFRLYAYVMKEMSRADARGSAEPLVICRKVMTELLEAYREVSRQDDSAPIMEHTQTVYAGLTYGKGELTESLSHERNRGFLV